MSGYLSANDNGDTKPTSVDGAIMFTEEHRQEIYAYRNNKDTRKVFPHKLVNELIAMATQKNPSHTAEWFLRNVFNIPLPIPKYEYDHIMGKAREKSPPGFAELAQIALEADDIVLSNPGDGE
jgi:hypothetical protein